MISALEISHIHSIHPFPARMAPSIVWESLPEDRSVCVLDPMAGSGTTLVSARKKGHVAIGCDTDPLALLIARAWCSDFDSDQLVYSAERVLEEARKLALSLRPGIAYPSQVDDETREFMDFWFDSKSRIQLTALSECISRVRTAERNLLWCAFSRLIITKKLGVSLAMDISHSRPHRKYQQAPVRPFAKFLDAVDFIARKAPFRHGRSDSPVTILNNADARQLPFRNNSVDMVITSPPYLNAIDYIRGHKFSLVWMGYSITSLRKIRSENIGSERSNSVACGGTAWREILDRMGDIKSLDQRYRSILLRYVHDMDRVFAECARLLRDDGQAIFVIGDSVIQGVFIRNSEVIVHLAKKNGFRLTSRTMRPLPENRRYLPPPNTKKSGREMQRRMKEEAILRFSPQKKGD